MEYKKYQINLVFKYLSKYSYDLFINLKVNTCSWLMYQYKKIIRTVFTK